MKNTLKLIFLLSILMVTQGVTLSQTTPQKFFDALIYDKTNITEYVNKDELEKSNRLGITYTGVKNKFMLGYELPDEIKEGIKSGKYKYEIKEQPLADSYTQVTLSVPDPNFSKIYYFDNGFVSNSTYYSSLWQKKESKYFRFSIEEPKYFNDYCIKRLDDFVDMIADTLGFTNSEKRILNQQKLGYIFCEDEKGVEKITGFSAKGLAMLGTDEVVTSYQTHFHEVAHLLINYKLKNLELYTLPFFMEGFAVAVGGRGGMAPRVVTDIGYYLQKTGELAYDSILTFDQFRNIDGSMSYPVAGLYNSFLLSELGVQKYLDIYRKVNGDLTYISNILPEQIDLPSNEKFNDFMSEFSNQKIMFVNESDNIRPITDGKILNDTFMLSDKYIKFFAKNKYKINFEGSFKTEYVSRKFIEVFGNDSYENNIYLIAVDDNSIDIYNLFNDELIYSYTKSLSMNPVVIPKTDDFYTFFINIEFFKKDFIGESTFFEVK